MRTWWQLWPGFFSPGTCKEIIANARELPTQDSTIGFGSANRQDSNFRRSKIRWMNRVKPEWQWLWTNIDHIFQTSNVNAFGFELQHFHEIQFTEYSEEYSGKYDWHEDLNWVCEKPNHRKLSMVLQLSEPTDYDGGELEFESKANAKQDLARFKEPGSVIVFPSFLSHRVTPVTRGIRYSLVTWCEGPRFR